MKQLFSKFMALPIPGKAMLGMAASGGVFAVLWFAGAGQVAAYVGIAMAVVSLALCAVAMVMKGQEKKKSKQVEESLAANSSASPSGVSRVEDRAKLDGLRRQFEGGIQTFKDYGKDLYSMPWFVVVGEPGSGKTAAIRHSGIGFPPGLQDQLQGTGGTVNMHWWFTDHAVLLDTAGRLMFEEVAPGENNEWREFLRLLRLSRPNCPINGMMLVIPADTLITDTANEIQRKAGKIAQQFDQIQRSLGVRFPVFVLITKSDLINGFREFFDDITDPVLTSQMLGWSNPAGLDEVFRPDRVEDHIETVRKRLLERRSLLLQDPVHTRDARGRRIDQVDALYEFPNAMRKLTSRLRLYLEMIFVSGEWSQKPLFLRGIYFTSSMREGDALDAALADTLGVSVKSLPEAKMWATDRSYFLKDVFVDKMFKESRLVTRASNAGQVKRRRSMLLAGSGLGAAALIGGATYFSYQATKEQIVVPSDLARGLRGWGEGHFGTSGEEGLPSDDQGRRGYVRAAMGVMLFRPADEKGRFGLDNTVEFADGSDLSIGGEPMLHGTLFKRGIEAVEASSGSAGLYALLAPVIGGGVVNRLGGTLGLAFQRLALEPTVLFSRLRLVGEGEFADGDLGWGAETDETRALTALLSLEVDRAADRKSRSAAFDRAAFTAMVRFASDPSVELAAVQTAAMEDLGAAFEMVYPAAGSAGLFNWPPGPDEITVERDGESPYGPVDAMTALKDGVDRFVGALADPRADGTEYGNLLAFMKMAEDFSTQERALRDVALKLSDAATVSAYQAAETEWLDEYDDLEKRRAGLGSSLEAVSAMFDREGLTKEAREKAKRTLLDYSVAAYDVVLAAFGGDEGYNALAKDAEANGALLSLHKRLQEGKAKLDGDYDGKIKELEEALDGGLFAAFVQMHDQKRAYERRMEAYALAREALNNDGAPTGAAADGLKTVSAGLDAGLGRLDELRPREEKSGDSGRGGPISEAVGSAKGVLSAVARHQRHGVIAAEIERLKNFKDRLVASPPLDLPTVAFAEFEALEGPGNALFGVEVNEGLLADFSAVASVLPTESTNHEPLVLDSQSLSTALNGEVRRAITGHIETYQDFWVRDVLEAFTPGQHVAMSWSEFQSALKGATFTDDVERAAAVIRRAVEVVAEPDRSAAVREFLQAADAESAGRRGPGGLDERRRATVIAWGGLPATEGRARGAVVDAVEGRTFLATYLPFGLPSAAVAMGPESRYFRGLTLLGLEVLARESGGDVQNEIRTVVSRCQTFPVTIDGSGSLTQDEIRALKGALDGVLGGQSAQAGERLEIEAIIEQIKDPAVESALRVLAGLEVMGSRTRGVLVQARPVVEYLANSTGIKATLALLGTTDGANTTAGTNRLKMVSILRDLTPDFIDGVTTTEGFVTRNNAGVTPFEVSMPVSRATTLRFTEAEGQPRFDASIEGYGPLRALASQSPERVAGSEAWPLELTLSDGRRMRVGVVFEDQGLAALLESWPRSENWRE